MWSGRRSFKVREHTLWAEAQSGHTWEQAELAECRKATGYGIHKSQTEKWRFDMGGTILGSWGVGKKEGSSGFRRLSLLKVSRMDWKEKEKKEDRSFIVPVYNFTLFTLEQLLKADCQSNESLIACPHLCETIIWADRAQGSICLAFCWILST